MESVYNELNRFLKGSTRFGINETIARFMLGNMDRIPDMKLSEIADECNTSTPSVIRFCRELGYEDFSDFKEVVREYWEDVQDKVLTPNAFLNLNEGDAAYERSVIRWVDQLGALQKEALLSLDRKKMKALAQDILKYRYVYLFGGGSSSHACEYLRVALARMGISVMTLSMYMPEVPLSSKRAETLSIIFSQHHRMLNANPGMLTYVSENSDRVWLITQDDSRLPERVPLSVLRLKDAPQIEMEIHIMLMICQFLCECISGLKEETE